MNNYDDLLEDIELFINSRTDMVYENNHNSTEDVIDGKYLEITNLLSAQAKSLLIDLMDLKTSRELIRTGETYKQGFKDGYGVFCLLNRRRI